jgi:hypothetical protein
VEQFESMINKNPQELYSMLLSPEALQKIPVMIQHSLLPILKTSLVEALHNVYLYGLVFVLIGAVFTFFLGQIKLSENTRQSGQGVK